MAYTIYIFVSKYNDVEIKIGSGSYHKPYMSIKSKYHACEPWELYPTIKGSVQGELSKPLALTIAHALRCPQGGHRVHFNPFMNKWLRRASKLSTHNYALTAVHRRTRTIPRDFTKFQHFSTLLMYISSLRMFSHLCVRYPYKFLF